MDSELGERRDLIASESDGTTDNGRDGKRIGAARPLRYTELFERLFPYYLSWGMSYDQYWHGDAETTRAYRKAHKLKLEEANQIAWMQGMYVYDAVCALSPILRAFSRARKPNPYTKAPYELFSHSEEADAVEETREERRQKNEDDKFNAYMMAWMSTVNKGMAKKAQAEDKIESGEGNAGYNDTGN